MYIIYTHLHEPPLRVHPVHQERRVRLHRCIRGIPRGSPIARPSTGGPSARHIMTPTDSPQSASTFHSSTSPSPLPTTGTTQPIASAKPSMSPVSAVTATARRGVLRTGQCRLDGAGAGASMATLRLQCELQSVGHEAFGAECDRAAVADRLHAHLGRHTLSVIGYRCDDIYVATALLRAH